MKATYRRTYILAHIVLQTVMSEMICIFIWRNIDQRSLEGDFELLIT